MRMQAAARWIINLVSSEHDKALGFPRAFFVILGSARASLASAHSAIISACAPRASALIIFRKDFSAEARDAQREKTAEVAEVGRPHLKWAEHPLNRCGIKDALNVILNPCPFKDLVDQGMCWEPVLTINLGELNVIDGFENRLYVFTIAADLDRDVV